MTQAGFYLINFIFDAYLWVLILRLLLQWQRVDFYNPLSQFVLRLTPFLPVRKGRDYVTISFALILGFLKGLLLMWLYASEVNIAFSIFQAFFVFAQQTLSLYFYLIIIVAVSSWFSGGRYHPVIQAFGQLIAPVLKPFRRILPPIAGFDLSPILALVVIKFLEIVVSTRTLGF